jgi:DNA polymerase-1
LSAPVDRYPSVAGPVGDDGRVADPVDAQRPAGLRRGELIALAVAGGRATLAHRAGPVAAEAVWTVDADELVAIEAELRPRWVWWSKHTPAALLPLRLATCWDLAAVHRLLFGGWTADPDRIWAALHDRPEAAIPALGQLDLLGAAGDDGDDAEQPVRPDGYLRPEWTGGGWARTPTRQAAWAVLALTAAQLQQARLGALTAAGDPGATARSESAAELLSAELETDGLPIDRARAEHIIASFIGPRPASEVEAQQLRARRDQEVLRLAPAGFEGELRNPGVVRVLLARCGIEVPDTRSWRLEPFVGAHPIVEAVLAWRKAERIASTYGYRWLDERVEADGRLRGEWSGSDGAAGRMTAQAGLHNLPADLRPAVVAEPGHLFVRADLGQIEPRILAAVSGDRAFARAAAADDLYAPVAEQLRVERPIAKVAVLAAMYGQTSGAAGEALRGLEAAYPVAMRYLREAYDSGRAGRDVRTHGGRLVRMWPTPPGLDEAAARSVTSGRGRYARNAVIQGAAAEFFKAWAVTVRARGTALDARIVLCLHDELLLHVPAESADGAAELLRTCLDETAARWVVATPVRFVADVSIVERWSDAK